MSPQLLGSTQMHLITQGTRIVKMFLEITYKSIDKHEGRVRSLTVNNKLFQILSMNTSVVKPKKKKNHYSNLSCLY